MESRYIADGESMWSRQRARYGADMEEPDGATTDRGLDPRWLRTPADELDRDVATCHLLDDRAAPFAVDGRPDL